jgi:LAS superfamily LD-carboxypeptidase LdcB
MSAQNKNETLRFGAIFIIAAVCCLFVTCDVNSIEQSSSNANTNSTVNKSQRLNFVASNQISNQTLSESNSNSSLNNTNSQANENTNNPANAEISEVAQAVPSEFGKAKQSSADSQFDSAAEQNQNLAKNLTWTFGGKTQTGWYLYKPLICNAIGVEVGASGNAFAAALSGWQKANALQPNGVLDAVTLALFVSKWQSNRLKIRGFANPNELLVAPTVDFYDPSRPDELRQVERETYVAYKKLIAAAIADKSLNLSNKDRDELAASEKFLKIVSSFRSRDYQDKLRRESPNSGRAGLAVGNSPHFTGRALDIYVGGEPVTTKDENRAVQINTKVYLWLVKNAGRFGFKPYFYEPWHWEYAPD